MNLSNRKKDFVVMNELQKFCVFLSQFDLTETKCRQIVDSLDDVSVSSFCSHKFDKYVLSEEMKDKMMMKADEILIKNYVYNLENQEIKLITKYDEEYPKKLVRLGIKDTFGKSGKAEKLMEYFGITAKEIIEQF